MADATQSTQTMSTPDPTRVTLDFGAIFRESWTLLRTNATLVTKVFGVMVIFSLMSNALLAQTSGVIQAVLQLGSFILQLLFGIGSTYIVLAIAANKPVELSALWQFTDKLLNYLILMVIYSLLVTVGFLLLVIPGVVWATKYGLAPLIIAWKKMEAMEAMRLSAQMTDGYKLQLFIFYLIIVVMNILGAVAFMVGLLITAPLTYIASGVVFHKLAARIPELSSDQPSA